LRARAILTFGNRLELYLTIIPTLQAVLGIIGSTLQPQSKTMAKLLATLRNGNLEPSEPIDLPEGTQLLITVNLAQETEDWTDEDLTEISLQGLNRAYGDDEPDYGEVEVEGVVI
jgi:hypothetical protein